MIKILIVEDDIKLNYLIRVMLEKNGFTVDYAYHPLKAFELMKKNTYSLIITDIMMPEMDGFEFTENIRKNDKELPILFITAKSEFEDKEKAFLLGCDDYMVKPLDLNELILRVNALLKRAKISMDNKIVIGSTVVDKNSLSVISEGIETVLTLKEFNILFKLLSFPNKTFTRTQIMNDCWGMYSESIDRTVDVHITHLREKFENNKDFEIVTIRGLGYKAIIHGKEN